MESFYQERFMIDVMAAGYRKAALAFGQIVGCKVQAIETQTIILENESDCDFISDEQELHILITQLIGDLNGKSYLIPNSSARQKILASLRPSANTHLHDAFIGEIDNIISAAVISEISNALKIEVYGDVPMSVKMNAGAFKALIKSDFQHAESRLIYSSTVLQIGDQENTRARFLWKFHSKIFQMIPTKMAS